MTIKILHKIDNFLCLQQEVMDLIQHVNPLENQIACQNSQEGMENWAESVGKIEDLLIKDETKYCFILKRLRNTEIERLILKYDGFRTRIMLMPCRKSYSVHKDQTPRIHIPIVTNEHAWMVWPYDNICYNLRPGVSYWTDTTKLHSYFNGDFNQTRIHLVINTHLHC